MGSHEPRRPMKEGRPSDAFGMFEKPTGNPLWVFGQFPALNCERLGFYGSRDEGFPVPSIISRELVSR